MCGVGQGCGLLWVSACRCGLCCGVGISWVSERVVVCDILGQFVHKLAPEKALNCPAKQGLHNVAFVVE